MMKVRGNADLANVGFAVERLPGDVTAFSLKNEPDEGLSNQYHLLED